MTYKKKETVEESEKRLAYHREYGKRPDARERDRARHRSENMTPEQQEARRTYNREYARRRKVQDPGYAVRLREDRARFRATEKGKNNQRNGHLKRAYGITLEQEQAMIAAQSGRCLTCQTPTDRLHVDHDHETGDVRGMLCGNCNRALGMVGEDVETLRRMIQYLSS